MHSDCLIFIPLGSSEDHELATVEIVAEAIKKTTSDTRILQSAEEIKASLAEENGVARAVAVLHEALKI